MIKSTTFVEPNNPKCKSDFNVEFYKSILSELIYPKNVLSLQTKKKQKKLTCSSLKENVEGQTVVKVAKNRSPVFSTA